MQSTKVKRAIAAFEKAVKDKAFIAAVPLRSDEEYWAAEHNYVKARAKLERLMENV